MRILIQPVRDVKTAIYFNYSTTEMGWVVPVTLKDKLMILLLNIRGTGVFVADFLNLW